MTYALTATAGIAAALALTLAIELPVAALLGLRDRSALLAVVAVNLITNPLLNLTLIGLYALAPAGGGIPYFAWLAAFEVAVVLAEWGLLRRMLGGSPARMLGVCAAMNALSLAAGLALRLTAV